MSVSLSLALLSPVTGEYGALATSYPRELLLDRLSHPRGLALDEQHRKIYFVERTGRIYECNIDGTNMEANTARPPTYKVLLVNRPSNVRLNSITLDTTSHTQRRRHALYWTESNTNAVMRSNIDGRKMQQVAGLNGRYVN